MKKQLIVFVLILGVLALFQQSCRVKQPVSNSVKDPSSFSLAFYNLENLFDTIDDPAINDEEFLPGSKKEWNSERYNHKLNRLAQVIDSLQPGSNGILGVCEFENESVLSDLNKRLNGAYQIYTVPSPDARGIDVGLLLKGNVEHLELIHKSYVFIDEPDMRTRNLQISRVNWNGNMLLVAVCHMPSRRGGQEASAGKRIQVAQQVRGALDSLLKVYPQAYSVVMGDMNDEPSDSSMQVLKASSIQPMLNLMDGIHAAKEGSYLYKGKWDCLDQILIGSAMNKLGSWTPLVYKRDWMLEQEGKYAGSPWRTFAGNKYLGGYSDHLPVIVTWKP
ncbi:MAG: hypothetical protein EP332_13395 [Bacteroidetes bacterium]|nr:MAG: hypothetical protein EP332_13395 [Bacteroidota bacterium]